MNIGLIDVDIGKWPNLSLMKLSAYFKSLGDTTMLVKPKDVLQGQFLFNTPDKLFGAVVFNKNLKLAEQLARTGVKIGGSAWDLKSRLMPEAESIYPDYSLYGITDTAYGFLTRGCPRQCSFCIVSQKEGKTSYKVADLKGFWGGQKNIKLLDPNLLACTEWESLLQQLIESRAWVDVNQGLDIRFMTKEKAAMINQIKIKMIHFAWDNYEFSTYEKLKYYRDKFKLDAKRLKVYVLTNFNTTHWQDLERVYKLRELAYDPYIMVYDKPNAPEITKLLQRWVNNKIIFNVVHKFEDYDRRIG